jgi:hypothetical protein
LQTSFQEDSIDRRVSKRASLYLAATVYHDGHPSPVKIRNISSAGALLESRSDLPSGALIQLVRGNLIVTGLVAWSSDGRYGLKFSGGIDVQQWRANPANAEQQRIDEVVRLVKAGAVPLAIHTTATDLPSDIEGLSDDLQRASDLLETLSDRLAKDGIVVAQYPCELQNLDIALQVIAAVGAILSGENDLATGAVKFINLRRSADQALGRAAICE